MKFKFVFFFNEIMRFLVFLKHFLVKQITNYYLNTCETIKSKINLEILYKIK